MAISIQILTATNHLDSVELERLALHNFRAPNLDELLIPSVEEQIELGIFTDTYVKCVVDTEEVNYYRNGDFVYCISKFRHTEYLQAAVADLILAERELGTSIGFVESDLTNLTLTTVYRAQDIDTIIAVSADIVVECTKRAFYM